MISTYYSEFFFWCCRYFPYEDENNHSVTVDIGNVTKELEITFQFAVKSNFMAGEFLCCRPGQAVVTTWWDEKQAALGIGWTFGCMNSVTINVSQFSSKGTWCHFRSSSASRPETSRSSPGWSQRRGRSPPAGKPLARLERLPSVSQVSYCLETSLCFRSQLWPGSLNMAILSVHCAQLCARLTMEGHVQEAQRQLKAQHDLLSQVRYDDPSDELCSYFSLSSSPDFIFQLDCNLIWLNLRL